MTSDNHDMPPRQPDENEPLDHPARDVLDGIDETVARITDANVDEHLRKVLDQAGYRRWHDRHDPGSMTARPAGDPRPAADTRRRPFARFLLALAGADPKIVAKAPDEWVKFERLACAIIATTGIAMVSMWFALTIAIRVNGILAVPIALLWGLVIMGIDRWLVTEMSIGSAWRKLAFAAPRIVLAVLLGALISTPLVLRIFQSGVNAEITAIEQQRLSEFLTEQQNSALGLQVAARRAQVNDLHQVIASDGRVPVSPSADPQTQSLNAQRTQEIALEQKYYQQWQCQLYGCNSAAGDGPAAQAAQDSYEQALAQVNELTNQIKNREAQLTATGAAAKTQAQAALPAAMQQLTAAQAQMHTLLENFRAQNSTSKGLPTRLDALDRLASNDPAVNAARLLLFLLLLVLECLPVTVKLLQQPGVYEKILAREIDKRVKIALIQEELQRRSQATQIALIQEEFQRRGQAARQEEPLPPALPPRDTMPAQASSGTEPLTVPDNLRREIENIYPFMKDTGEATAPEYREELENCFLAISRAVNELLRHGYDNDQITDALRVTADMATQQLAAAWQDAVEKEPSA